MENKLTKADEFNKLTNFDLKDSILAKRRNNIFYFANFFFPQYYKADKQYLIDYCYFLEDLFLQKKEIKNYFCNFPPRHFKTLTISLAIAFSLGYFKNLNLDNRIIVGYISYSDSIGTQVSRQIKEVINSHYYKILFPYAKLKYGNDAVTNWALEGDYSSFTATGIDGSLTGKGFTIIVFDDIVKNVETALSKTQIEKLNINVSNTAFSRGDKNLRILFNNTAWVKDEPAEVYKDSLIKSGEEYIAFIRKVEENGKFLNEDIVDKKKLNILKNSMEETIFRANYYQEFINKKGALYKDFKYYDNLPTNLTYYGYIDTADKGEDYTCLIIYGLGDNEEIYYIRDCLYTKNSLMEIKQEVFSIIKNYNLNILFIEGHSFGSYFGEEISIMLTDNNLPTEVTNIFYGKGDKKEVRIFSNSVKVMNCCFFPSQKLLNKSNNDFIVLDDYKIFMEHLQDFQRIFKNNKNDDCADSLTGIIYSRRDNEIYFG